MPRSAGVGVREGGWVGVELTEAKAMAIGAVDEVTETLLLEDTRLVVDGGEVKLAAELNEACVDVLDWVAVELNVGAVVRVTGAVPKVVYVNVPEGEEESASEVGLIEEDVKAKDAGSAEEEALPEAFELFWLVGATNTLMMELTEAMLDAAAVGVAGVVDEGTVLALSSVVVAGTVARSGGVLLGVGKEDCVVFREWVSSAVALGVAEM
jgi:hypothetical protein